MCMHSRPPYISKSIAHAHYFVRTEDVVVCLIIILFPFHVVDRVRKTDVYLPIYIWPHTESVTFAQLPRLMSWIDHKRAISFYRLIIAVSFSFYKQRMRRARSYHDVIFFHSVGICSGFSFRCISCIFLPFSFFRIKRVSIHGNKTFHT